MAVDGVDKNCESGLDGKLLRSDRPFIDNFSDAYRLIRCRLPENIDNCG